MTLFETNATGLVGRVIEKAPVRGRLSLIHGARNVGKSCAVDLAAREREWVRRIVLPPGAERPSPRAFFAEVAMEMGLDVRPGWTAGQVAREIAGRCHDDGLTLVLDQCDTLRQWELDALRYLVDRLGHLVMVGGGAMLLKVSHHDGLRACCRLPFEMPPTDEAEVQTLLGERFSADFLSRLVALRGGVWGDVMTVVDGFEQRGIATRSLGADDADTACRQWLLRGSDVAPAAAARAAA